MQTLRMLNAGAAVIIMLLFIASEIRAQVSLTGGGAKLFFVDPEGIESAIGIGLFADLGEVLNRTRLEAHLDYWSKSYEFGVDAGSSSFRDIAISAMAKYMMDSPRPELRPFIGGGLSLHVFRSKITAKYFTEPESISKSEAKIGIDLGGGAFYAINPQIELLAELKFRLVSDINQLMITVGALYNLGK